MATATVSILRFSPLHQPAGCAVARKEFFFWLNGYFQQLLMKLPAFSVAALRIFHVQATAVGKYD